MGVLAPGTVVGGCRIEGVVGQGGMGVVYRARQLELERDVALKVITPRLTDDPVARGRFLAEARAAAAVEHPHVVPVHAVGTDGERAYLVMRFVRGDDLGALVRRDGPLGPARAAAVTEQLGDALDAIHRAGFVHRDVKPPNVLLDDDGHVYLSDFGLAKAALATRGPTAEDHWVGTLDYVAPEQIRGDPVDARTDVYALGGVLHFMLTGHPPYPRDRDEAKLWAHLNAPPPKPSAAPGVPAGFDAVVARALAKDPGDRYARAGALGHDAVAAAHGDEPDAATWTARMRDRKGGGRRRAVAALAGMACVAAVAAIVLRSDGRQPAREPRPTPVPSPSATREPERPLSKVRTERGMSDHPEGVAIADGYVWVIASRRDSPIIVRRESFSRRPSPDLWRHASDIAADGDSVWISYEESERRVVRLDARTGSIEHEITTPVEPELVAVGGTGLWVASQDGPTDPAFLRRYTRDGRTQLAEHVIPEGVADIVHGGGALWVALRNEPAIMRLDGRGREVLVRPREPARTLAYGAGALWAITRASRLMRIDPATRETRTKRLRFNPGKLAVSGDLVVVTQQVDRHLLVLDARTLKRRGPLVPVAWGPYGIAAEGRDVWVTGVTDNTLTHLRRR